MRVRYNVGAMFGGGGSKEPQYFKDQPSAADQRAQEQAAAEEAKRKSLAESAKKQGAGSTLITAPDLGGEFGGLKTRKSLLGGV